MIVEVKGIGLPNRGAELMLIGVIQGIKKQFPHAEFVLMSDTSFQERCKHKVWQKFDLQFKGIDFFWLGKLIPRRLRRNWGLILDCEIDLTIDASGFAYGDQWGPKKAFNRTVKYLSFWHQQNRPLIYMPQAFGPFSSTQFKDDMARVLSYANLVFARDRKSYQHLLALSSGSDSVSTPENLHQAPDFTNVVTGYVPSNFTHLEQRVCFIANAKMLEKGDPAEASSYIDFMASLIQHSLLLGKQAYFLLHEGTADLALSEKINAQLDSPIPLVQTDDALAIKGIIGTAKVVVSSRYHGLVSALSQGVPVIATGWSHKYRALLEDYDCSDYLLKTTDTKATDILENLLKPDIYSCKQKAIKSAARVEKSKTEHTWQLIAKVLDKLQYSKQGKLSRSTIDE